MVNDLCIAFQYRPHMMRRLNSSTQMKYTFSLIILFFFAASQGLYAQGYSLDDDGMNPLPTEFGTDDSDPYQSPSVSQPTSTQPYFQPQTASSPQPLARPTQTDSLRVPFSMRSQMDPDNPFSRLQLDSAPVDTNSRITGKPLTVCEMLEFVSSPQTRCQLLHAYWGLAGEIAKYKILLVKQVQITKWTRDHGSTNARSPVFQAAGKHVIAQCQSQELLVILKQTELAALLKQTGHSRPIVQANQPVDEQLPIPADLPFIGGYQTHVNQLVQFRPTSNLVLLDKTIALRKQLFESKFDESAAMEELIRSLENSEDSVAALIQANSQYFASYAECIDAIIAYNETIAEYVALTVGPEITGRRLLRTLIQLNPEQNSESHHSENPADSVPVVEYQ